MDGKEIRWRLKTRGLKQIDLARHLKMEPNKLTKSLNGERRFTVEEMDKVRDFLPDVPLDGQKLGPSLPLIGYVPGGNWKEAVKNPIGSIPRVDPTIPANAFALKVEGDSMGNVAPDGSTIILDPDDKDLYPGRFYVVMVDGEVTFKQFKSDPARLAPCSDDPRYEDIRIGGGLPFEIVARVIWAAARL